MASVTLMLKANKVDQNGEMPLYIRIIKGRKPKFISLGLKIHPQQWNEKKLRVKSPYPNAGRVNAFIARKLAEAEDIALTIETKEKYVSSKKIKEAIVGKSPVSLIAYADQYIKDLKAQGKIGTHNRVNTVLNKLKTYLNTLPVSRTVLPRKLGRKVT